MGKPPLATVMLTTAGAAIAAASAMKLGPRKTGAEEADGGEKLLGLLLDVLTSDDDTCCAAPAPSQVTSLSQTKQYTATR